MQALEPGNGELVPLNGEPELVTAPEPETKPELETAPEPAPEIEIAPGLEPAPPETAPPRAATVAAAGTIDETPRAPPQDAGSDAGDVAVPLQSTRRRFAPHPARLYEQVAGYPVTSSYSSHISPSSEYRRCLNARLPSRQRQS